MNILADKVRLVLDDMKTLYLQDSRPWIIGLSGGKDSTCITQLVYSMLLELPPDKRHKRVYVLSADVMVESPHADYRRKHICGLIEKQVEIDKIPLSVETLRPILTDTFWVNLIGRGYPSPNRWFRWCTDRMKIRPMNRFVYSQIKENGEVIMVLGIRKSESVNRKRAIERYEISGTKLSQHSEIKGALVYAPISDWDDIEDVREFLRSTPSPWQDDNNKFLHEYYSRGESDTEFITDKESQSAGATRMGCWTCTVVPRDHSLEWYIKEGQTWLEPLVEYRNWIHEIRDGPNYREEARKGEKKKKIYADILGKEFTGLERYGHKVYGPFTMQTRHEMLERLLMLTKNNAELKYELDSLEYTLITPEEIQAIVQLWIYEGDSIQEIRNLFSRCEMDAPYISNLFLEKDAEVVLNDICSLHEIPTEVIHKMIIAENDRSHLARRYGVYNKLENILESYVLEEMLQEAKK